MPTIHAMKQLKNRANAKLIKQPKTGRKLTPKMFLFCVEYVCNGWNATQAAISAGYSAKNARSIGCRLSTNVNILNQIQKVRDDKEKTLGISSERVVREHMKLAFNSIAHLHNTWIERKDFEELTDAQKECIAEISTQTRRVVQSEQLVEVEFVKIKLYDKQKALDSISKIMGYDAPIKQEHTGINLPGVVQFLRVDRSTGDVAMSEAEIKEKEGL